MALQTREITMPTSKTQSLIDYIREKISSGDWPPGHQLPSRSDLMREHTVSLTVVRDAQKELVWSGELVSMPGVGYFVAEHHPIE
jgi:DNA-binding GntR family transcriptional regulator